jgi:hypothetical protein
MEESSMKKSILVMCVLLLSAAWVVAQTSDSSSQSSSAPSSSAQSQSSPSGSSATSQSGSSSSSSQTGATTDQSSQPSSQSGMSSSSGAIQGCLSGSDGNYTLTDSASGKTYSLSGTNADLKAHVGQQVEVVQASSAAGMPSSSTSGATNDRNSTTGTVQYDASNAGSSSASQTVTVTSVRKISDTCSTK